MANVTKEPDLPKPSISGDGKASPPVVSDSGDLSKKPADQLPSPETLQKVASYPVLDREKKEIPFRDLYSKSDASRILIIFVRHFYCGSCQEYLHTLSEAITPAFLSQLPVSTSIAIIGCGDPALIDSYASETGCPYPIYADPTQKLYDDLAMARSLALGPQPKYIRKGIARITAESMWRALKQVPNGLLMKGGDHHQNGGEFLFELRGEEKTVTWCHRMTTTRDHTEVPELVRVLER